MSNHETMYPPRAYKMLVAIIVDIVVCFSFFTFFQFILTPVVDNVFGYNDLLVTHNEKLVEYGLGGYELDESGNEIFIEYMVGEGENALSKEDYDAAKLLFEQDAAAQENARKINAISLISMSVILLLAIIPNYLIFPLIHKNGQTIGKRLMRIAIVNKDGTAIRYRRLLFRTLIGLYLCEILISYLIYTMFGIPLVLCLSGLVAVFSVDKRSIADYIAGTAQVDSEISIIGN